MASLKPIGCAPESSRRGSRLWLRHVGYPPPSDWAGGFVAEDYAKVLRGIGTRPDEAVSVFVQVPFCSVRCLYCGSDVTVNQSGDDVDGYLDALERELDLVAAELGRGRLVRQLHLGGGSPNSLTESQLLRLMEAIEGRFEVREDADTSVNCDPRRACASQFDLMRAFGVRGVRFGVPDVKAEVQRSIGRIQSVELLRDVCAMAREAGFETVGLDLTYGLPNQTQHSFRTTVEAVIELEPDRVACFGFRNLPGSLLHRGAINADSIPTQAQRSGFLRQAVEALTAAGYVWIGLDQFTRRNDELARAQGERRLNRNLIGYTARGSRQVVALGVGGIGAVDDTLIQNQPKMNAWQAAVLEGELPVCRGHRLSDDERRRRDAIVHLLCNLELPAALASRGLEHAYERLRGRVAEGLVELMADRIVVTARGRPRLADLCADLDEHWAREGTPWLL